MSTRIIAAVSAIVFVAGTALQYWSFQLGLTLMLLGTAGATTSVLVMQRAIQRRLIKHDRFFTQLQRTMSDGRAETTKYGSSIFRRVKLLTGEEAKGLSSQDLRAENETRPKTAGERTNTVDAVAHTATQTRLINSQSPSEPIAPGLASKSELLPTETVLESLKRAFHTDPTGRNLEDLLIHMWNVLGEITKPASLLHRYPNLVGDFTSSGKLLARQIIDAADLCAELPRIPPRSHGSLVVPVPERVLYCTHATPTFHSNGYAVRTRGVAEGLVANGQHVRVLGRPGYPWDVKGTEERPHSRQFERVGGVEYVHIPSVGLNSAPKGGYIQEAADAVVDEALNFRPSVIQAASNSQTALIALIAARRLGLPFIYEVRGLWEVTYSAMHDGWDHSERYKLDVALETLVVREADAIAVITRQLGDELVRRGADRDRISIVPNSVDIESLQPLLKDATYEAVPGLSGELLVGFAGSLVSYEGLDLLVHAIGKLNASGTRCHLVLAGSGAHESTLKRLVDDSGLGDVVHFVGRIPHEDVRRLLASLDVIVCPRKSNRVTEMVSPIKPLEAFAAGRVVLMSDVEPQRDLASRGEIAPLFTADDPDALANSLHELLVDPELRRDYERRARLWVGDHRTWRAVCVNLLEAYKSAQAAHQAALASTYRELPDFTVALAGSTGPYLDLCATCEIVELSPDPKNWHETLLPAEIDLVVLGPDKAEQWEVDTCTRLLQIASESNIPTLMISDGPIGADNPRVELLQLADHVGIANSNSLDAKTSVPVGSSSTVSRIRNAFDPRVFSPLRLEPRTSSVAVLGGSIPTDQVLDVARAHNLRVMTYDESKITLPTRFNPNLQAFTNFDEAIQSASATVGLLRGTDGRNCCAHANVTAIGAVEIITDASTDLDWLDEHLTKMADDPQEWAKYAWKSVRRANQTGGLRLATAELFRAAGIEVAYRAHPSYCVHVSNDHQQVIEQLLSQTVLPSAIVLTDDFEIDPILAEDARDRGIEITRTVPQNIEYFGPAPLHISSTFYEDLLTATRFSDCYEVCSAPINLAYPRLVSVNRSGHRIGQVMLTKNRVAERGDNEVSIVVHQPLAVSATPPPNDVQNEAKDHSRENQNDSHYTTQRILIAGHDLKFIDRIISNMEDTGIFVSEDKWDFHNSHNEEQSRALLSTADSILCEWGLGNAVWYSQNKRSDQRLVVRVHLQELSTPYLKQIHHPAVDKYVFVSEIVRSAAVAFHGVPRNKTCVIPNALDISTLKRPKDDKAHKTIGFVGAVPQRKRLDLALDVLTRVRAIDPEYRLIIKGKGPQDYPWMANRPDEMAWYRQVYDRIDEINSSSPGAVLIEPHSNDMADWYSGIGVALSTSDFESFHYTIADGVASGARPAVLYWPGADSIYPRRWLANSVDQLARSIVHGMPESGDFEFVAQNFAVEKVSRELLAVLLGVPNPATSSISGRSENDE